MRLLIGLLPLVFAGPTFGGSYYVAPGGDANPGTLERPFATLHRAQQSARERPGSVFLRGGTHYLQETLVFSAEDSGTRAAPFVYQAYGDEQPVISGGIRLEALDWQAYRDGIYQANVPADLQTEEIFVNGERQILARYPNFDPSAQYFDGFAEDAISKERVTRWADPAGGYFHAMHPALWGDFTWRITGKDGQGGVTMEGGWQNNRTGAVHEKIRFVENVFEELDAPGEWFLDGETHTLYFYPPSGLDLASATVEATRLRCLVEFRGTETQPVRFVTLRGLTFRHRRARSWTPRSRCCGRIGRSIAVERFSSKARKIVRSRTVSSIRSAGTRSSSTITTAASRCAAAGSPKPGPAASVSSATHRRRGIRCSITVR